MVRDRDCAFSADSAYMVSASSDHTAKLWDVNKGTSIVNYAHGAIRFTHFALQGDGTLRCFFYYIYCLFIIFILLHP